MKQKLFESYKDFFLQTHTERFTFYRTSLGLHTLLASNVWCFKRIPPLATIVLKAFVITRQLRRFGFTVFFVIVSFFQNFLTSTKGPPSLVLLILCNQQDDLKNRFLAQGDILSKRLHACKDGKKTKRSPLLRFLAQ